MRDDCVCKVGWLWGVISGSAGKKGEERLKAGGGHLYSRDLKIYCRSLA